MVLAYNDSSWESRQVYVKYVKFGTTAHVRSCPLLGEITGGGVMVDLPQMRGDFRMIENKTVKSSTEGYIKVLEGVERKTLVYGNNTMLTEFRLQKGKLLPMHKHPQEQTGYLVSGHLILIISGERHDVMPGDSWIIPGDVDHGAEVLEDAIAVEVFSPIREDYLPE